MSLSLPLLSAGGPAAEGAVRHGVRGSVADGLGLLVPRVRSALCHPSYPFRCCFRPHLTAAGLSADPGQEGLQAFTVTFEWGRGSALHSR